MKRNRIRELYQQYVGGMKAWQIKLAIARITRFGVPPNAWEDTMQELAMVIQQFRFDPDKAHAASEETILCRLLDNRIRMLARANARRLALLERFGQMAQNIEDTHTGEDDAVAAEVRQVVSQLSSLEQKVCRALMEGVSIYEVARLTGKHYTVIRRHVDRIRQVFTDKGFDLWSA